MLRKLRLSLPVLLASFFFSAPAPASEITQDEIQSCVNNCIGAVLSGQRNLTDCVWLTLATRQIVGPPARTKTDVDLLPIVAVIEGVLRERIDRFARDFVGSYIEVNYHEPSARQPHIYGVSGWVRRPGGGDYEFSANGRFTGTGQCQLYTLSVGPISINRWLREQPAVDSAIELAIRRWANQP